MSFRQPPRGVRLRLITLAPLCLRQDVLFFLISNYSVGQDDHIGLLKNVTKNQLKNFGGSEIMPTFASQSGKRLHRLAKIAQLVEHDLAKVGVAGSSPVFRSTAKNQTLEFADHLKQMILSPDGGIGRRATLRG